MTPNGINDSRVTECSRLCMYKSIAYHLIHWMWYPRMFKYKLSILLSIIFSSTRFSSVFLKKLFILHTWREELWKCLLAMSFTCGRLDGRSGTNSFAHLVLAFPRHISSRVFSLLLLVLLFFQPSPAIAVKYT